MIQHVHPHSHYIEMTEELVLHTHEHSHNDSSSMLLHNTMAHKEAVGHHHQEKRKS